MKAVQKIVISLAIIMGAVAMPLMTPAVANAAACANAKDCLTKGSDIETGTGSQGLPALIKSVVNVLLYIIGVIAVIMIVIGGIKFTTSNGDSGSVKSAKDTVLYSVVGLVLAIMAYAIVNWVIGAF